MASDHEQRVQEMCEVYAGERQIGLVLGAGVAKASGVPNWIGLGLSLFDKARKERCLRGMSSARAFLEEQLQRWKSGGNTSPKVDPETVLMLVCDCIEPRSKIRKLVKDALFENIEKRSHNMVAARTYRKNKTLDAVITFCAGTAGSPVASGRGGRWQTNRKVGAILTTNYDNLIEGAFNSKYGKRLLHPVAREGAREQFKDRRIIPVYHMHGYLSYVDAREKKDGVKGSDLVLSEKDYYETFNNPLAFLNMMAGSYFRRFTSIFIGCSMTDKNIRRILYLLQRERIVSSEFGAHYAILPRGDWAWDDFEDEVLNSFGVRSVRVPGKAKDMGVEVAAILKRMYLQEKGVKERHWVEAENGKWKGRSVNRKAALRAS